MATRQPLMSEVTSGKGILVTPKWKEAKMKMNNGSEYNANPLKRRKTIERRLMFPFYA
jgi:hypothetical protein